MSKEDPFDEIVRRLDLDLTFPAPTPVEDDDDAFYRHVEPPPARHLNVRHLWAWLGVISGPVAIMVASLVHVILPRPMLLGIALLFVASAVFLIAQLPDRGPAEPDWPDDGAQL